MLAKNGKGRHHIWHKWKHKCEGFKYNPFSCLPIKKHSNKPLQKVYRIDVT